MQDVFATTILPYSLTAGVIASVLVSLVLIVTTIKRSRSNDSVFARLAKIESDLKQNAQNVEMQMIRSSRIDPDRARHVMADLSAIAVDLQRRTEEAQSILDDLRNNNRESGTVEAARKIADLDIGVGEAGSRVKNLLRRLENERQQLSQANLSSAIGQP